MQTDGRTDGQTDRYGEDNSRFSQFCGRVYQRKIEFWVIVFKGLFFTSFFCFILLLVPAIGFY